MTATAAKAAFGVALARDGNAIAEITNLSSPEVTLESIDVTSHDSDNDFREFIGGVLDGGEITLEGNFIAGDTTGQIGLQTDQLAKTLQTFVITFPTSLTATWTFTALVTKFKAGDFPIDGKQPFSATLKISGKPVLAITASTGLTTPFFTMSESAVIAPAAATATLEYVATVLTGVASVTITPTAAAGVIKVNGNTVGTGVPSSAVTLGAAGSITDITVTVTETGKVAKTYVVHVVRASA